MFWKSVPVSVSAGSLGAAQCEAVSSQTEFSGKWGGRERLRKKRRKKKKRRTKPWLYQACTCESSLYATEFRFAATSSSFHLISVTESASVCFAWSTLSSPLSPSFPSADYKSQAGRTRALHVHPVRSWRHRRNGRPPIDLTSVETPGQT